MRSWACLLVVFLCGDSCWSPLLGADEIFVEPFETPLVVLVEFGRCVMGLVPCHAF